MFIKSIQTSDLSNYKNQILNFTKTLTIKYEPIVEKLNDIVRSKGEDVDPHHYETWKYYLNIQGEYHSVDTLMYITSLDTGERVLFSKDMLDVHIKTKMYYRLDSVYYKELCNRYPDQIDLIKNILYPVRKENIEFAYNAKNCTLLAYDESNEYLEVSEQEYLVEKLKEFLKYLDTRWYYDFLKNEYSFYWVFWAIVWTIIPNILYAYRVNAIKTPYAHTWHIWQYLMSKGLDDYSDALNRDQTMFLYRNIDYILENVGKQSTLIILVNNLLSTLGIGLYGRDIEEQTLTKRANAMLTPEYTPIKLPTFEGEMTYDITPDTTSILNARLISSNLEVRDTNSWINDLDDRIGNSLINKTATKFLELRLLNKNKKYADVFFKFMLETLIYTVDLGIYNSMVEFVEPLSGTYVSLTVKEALILLYYSQCRVYRQMPVDIPNMTYYSSIFRKDPDPVKDKYTIHKQIYETNTFINLKNYLNYQKYPITIRHDEDFTKFATNAFLDFLNQRFIATRTNDYIVRCIASRIGDAIYLKGLRSIKLSDCKTYNEWFDSNSEFFENVITIIENSPESIDTYVNLSDLLIGALMPYNDIMKKYGNFTVTNSKYKRLKELLIQLTSYNITFLDTSSNLKTYLPVIGGSFDPYKVTFTETNTMLVSINGHDVHDIVKEHLPHSTDLSLDVYDIVNDYDNVNIMTHYEGKNIMSENISFKNDRNAVVATQKYCSVEKYKCSSKYFKFKSDESYI